MVIPFKSEPHDAIARIVVNTAEEHGCFHEQTREKAAGLARHPCPLLI